MQQNELISLSPDLFYLFHGIAEEVEEIYSTDYTQLIEDRVQLGNSHFSVCFLETKECSFDSANNNIDTLVIRKLIRLKRQ